MYIEKRKLTPYDAKDSGGETVKWYRVRKTWADSKSQKGTYKVLANAKKCADQNPGYKEFDADGKVVYEPKTAEPAVKVPFLVQVKISDLNIKKGPGTNYDRLQFCPPGIYTIVTTSSGAWASLWGETEKRDWLAEFGFLPESVIIAADGVLSVSCLFLNFHLTSQYNFSTIDLSNEMEELKC